MRTMLVGTNEPRERQDEPFGVVNLITVFFPLLLLAIPFIFLNRHMKKSRVAIERNMEHMNRMEEKTDRIVALLEAIRDERSKM